MTIAIIPMPDRAYPPLTTQVPELENRGGECYRAGYIIMSNACMAAERRELGNAYCFARL